MAKHTIPGFVTYEKSYQPVPIVRFTMYRPSPKYSPHEVVVAEHSIEVEVPDGFDPIPHMVSALEEKKRLARLDLAKELASIDNQIKQLTSIDYVAPTPDEN
jgi:hypothetical protein